MATATAPESVKAPPKKGKKKMLLLAGATLLTLGLLGAGGVVFYLKSKHAAEALAEDGVESGSTAATNTKRDPKAVPTFVPLDPFTVNLSDREAERYAQVGISLELTGTAGADQIKAYMPAIRNNILMVLAHKSAAELLERDGKAKLAAEIRSETSRALGYEAERTAKRVAAAEEDDEEGAPRKRRAKAVAADPSPVVAVHFSNFIIQ
ncbi:MAG TPA: flagellar basal body-associated FliL family protein [Rubrivivax sp.]